MSKDKVTRADFMSARDKAAMEGLPRTHENCLEKTGRARPGKTAYDRWKRHNATSRVD